MKWVYELPLEIRNEILRDTVRIVTDCCGDEIDLYDVVNNVMREKIVNVLGEEEHGQLSWDKYCKWL